MPGEKLSPNRAGTIRCTSQRRLRSAFENPPPRGHRKNDRTPAPAATRVQRPRSGNGGHPAGNGNTPADPGLRKLIHKGTSRSEAVHSLTRQNKHFSPEFFRALVELIRTPKSAMCGSADRCAGERHDHPTGDPDGRGNVAGLQRSGGYRDASLQAQELARPARAYR